MMNLIEAAIPTSKSKTREIIFSLLSRLAEELEVCVPDLRRAMMEEENHDGFNLAVSITLYRMREVVEKWELKNYD